MEALDALGCPKPAAREAVSIYGELIFHDSFLRFSSTDGRVHDIDAVS
jgi:hypothetical protein